MLGLLGREERVYPKSRKRRPDDAFTITFINKILILMVYGRVAQLGYFKNVSF